MTVAEIHAEAKRRYWGDKDLPAARRLLEEGIMLARSQNDQEAEKPLQYDLASFCWPGWDESGIAITKDDIEAGTQAAEENLRLAQELNRPPKGIANALFILGAYDLSHGRFRHAARRFRQQEHLARLKIEDPEDTLLAKGYRQLAERLAGKDVSFGMTVEQLRTGGYEHGVGLANQIETAGKVFGYTPGRYEADPDDRHVESCIGPDLLWGVPDGD